MISTAQPVLVTSREILACEFSISVIPKAVDICMALRNTCMQIQYNPIPFLISFLTASSAHAVLNIALLFLLSL